MTHHDPAGDPLPGAPFAPPAYGGPPAHGAPPPHGGGPGYGGQPGYGGPPAWAGYAPRPDVPGGLATTTVVLAAAVTAVQVIVWLTSFSAADVFAAAARSGVPSIDVFTAYDTIGLLLFLPLQFAAGIVTCIWLWRSREIAVAVSPGLHHARSRVWVWLGWIVPVVAFWFPYQVVRDVRASVARGPLAGLGWWWAGWLVFGLATNVGAQLTATSSLASAETFSLLPVAEGVGTAGAVLALVFWTRVVREITAGQRAAAAAASAPTAWS
ncbi:DUF4328 domain-containing protein [Cellulosimicrobium terreum]|nr:DUF4328 domain-containing protein [Cellulosimicrobium terreum]